MQDIVQDILDFLVGTFSDILNGISGVLDSLLSALNNILSILNSGLFNFLLTFVIGLFNIIMLPLTMLIKNLLPFVYEDFLTPINDLINAFINFVPFIADLTFLPSFIIHMLVNYLIFKYTVKFTVFSIKLIVKWWNYLKG